MCVCVCVYVYHLSGLRIHGLLVFVFICSNVCVHASPAALGTTMVLVTDSWIIRCSQHFVSLIHKRDAVLK